MSYQEQLKDMLFSLFPEAKLNGAKTEVMINCPFCNKEGRLDTNRHMYISLGYNDKPPQYNCFKNSKHRGLLTKNALNEMTNYSPLINDELLNDIQSNTKTNNIYYKNTINELQYYPFKIPLPSNNIYIEEKINYINNRLGLNLSLNELVYNKVIFSLKEFLIYNKIQTITRSQNTIELLDKYFIGFLNNNNSVITFRNICKDDNILPQQLQKRYIYYTILEKIQNGHYIIPSTCDIYKHITLNIAEGIFDILSIFYNLQKANRENNICVAIGGNAYLKTIQYFLETIGLIDLEIHIYIDNDIDKNILNKIKKILTPLQIPVFIHINMAEDEKDFGVPINRIKEYSYTLI